MPENSPEKLPKSSLLRSTAETDLELRSLSRKTDPVLSTKKTLESLKGNLSDFDVPGLEKLQTIDDIMTNPRLKEAVDVFQDEKKLGKFNGKIENIQKIADNPLVKKFANKGGGIDTIEYIDNFTAQYTEKDAKGSQKIKPLKKVLSDSYKSGNGFFSGIWKSLKSLVGYSVARKYKDDLLLWGPARTLAEDIKSQSKNIADTAKKTAATAANIAGEVKDHKADKLALEHVKNKQKKELNNLYKKGSSIHAGDLVSKTQKIYGDAFEQGMKADPDGFKKQLNSKKGVNGMKITKGLGGLMVAQMSVDALITGLDSDDFGDFKEQFFEWENMKSWIPGVGVWTGGKKLIKLMESKEPASTAEIVDVGLDVIFGVSDIGFVLASFGSGIVLKGGTKIAQSEIREQMMKKLGKKYTKEQIEHSEKAALKKIAKDKAGSSIGTGAKAARGQLITLGIPSIKDAFLKFTPSGRIFSKFFLNKEQKRFLRIAKNKKSS